MGFVVFSHFWQWYLPNFKVKIDEINKYSAISWLTSKCTGFSLKINNNRSKGWGRRTKIGGKRKKINKKGKGKWQKKRNGNKKIGLEHDAQNDFPDKAFFLCDNFFDNNTTWHTFYIFPDSVSVYQFLFCVNNICVYYVKCWQRPDSVIQIKSVDPGF